jgi:hypothetical protein
VISVEEIWDVATLKLGLEPLEGLFAGGICLAGRFEEKGPVIFLAASAKDAEFVDAYAAFAEVEDTSPEEAIERVGMMCRFGLQVMGPFYTVRTFFYCEHTSLDSFLKEIGMLHSAAHTLKKS